MFSNFVYALGVYLPPKINTLINGDNTKKETVYVVGNGWASYYFVKNLNKKKFNPIIVAPNEKVLNTPKLVSRVIDPYENVEFSNPYAEKIKDIVTDIDVENKTLITKSGSIYAYKDKKVVFAIGSESNDFGIPGVNEYTYKLKTKEDANKLRRRVLELVDVSKVFIIGSGPTGIELASKLYKINNISSIKIIEGMKEILPGFNEKTKLDIENKLKHIGINNINKSHMVKLIDKNNIMMMLDSKQLKQHYCDQMDLIVWTGGVRFNGFGKTTLFNSLNKLSPIKPRGIEVNKDFTIKNKKDIYCLGDMVGNMGPPTAQNAKNQAIWLANYFNSGFDNSYVKTNPYEIKSKGKIIHLGDKVYLESEYYTGYVPKIFLKFMVWYEL